MYRNVYTYIFIHVHKCQHVYSCEYTYINVLIQYIHISNGLKRCHGYAHMNRFT